MSSKILQGNIEETYHHIEAPCVRDRNTHKLYLEETDTLPRMATEYLSEDYLLLQNMMWNIKRKLDGCNIRIQWDGDRVIWNGKTNLFQDPNGNVQKFMDGLEYFEEMCEENLGRDKVWTFYGEAMGPKIQGNELKLDNVDTFIFDIKVGDVFLGEDSIKDICSKLGLNTVYDTYSPYNISSGKLCDLINMCINGELEGIEGIVATPVGDFRNRMGKRIITKIKNADFRD